MIRRPVLVCQCPYQVTVSTSPAIHSVSLFGVRIVGLQISRATSGVAWDKRPDDKEQSATASKRRIAFYVEPETVLTCNVRYLCFYNFLSMGYVALCVNSPRTLARGGRQFLACHDGYRTGNAEVLHRNFAQSGRHSTEATAGS